MCVVFNESQAKDVETYIQSVEDRLVEIKTSIANLPYGSGNQQDL